MSERVNDRYDSWVVYTSKPVRFFLKKKKPKTPFFLYPKFSSKGRGAPFPPPFPERRPSSRGCSGTTRMQTGTREVISDGERAMRCWSTCRRRRSLIIFSKENKISLACNNIQTRWAPSDGTTFLGVLGGVRERGCISNTGQSRKGEARRKGGGRTRVRAGRHCSLSVSAWQGKYTSKAVLITEYAVCF